MDEEIAVNQTPHPYTTAAGKAANVFAAELRALLARLQQQVVDAEGATDGSPAAQLVEANEQLVLAMLRAHHEAETCAQALEEVSQTVGLDPLTALPNRVLMLDRFAHAIATAKRHGTRLAVLFLDLNGFKSINDTFGHAVGDEVLKQAAHCLASLVRGSDTVSRHGGDEFLILLTEVGDISDAVLIAEKVIAGLGTPRRVDEHVIRLTASVGISLYPDHGEDPSELIGLADAAMYLAKARGLGSCVVHGAEATLHQGLALPALASLQRPVTAFDRALAEHERRLAELREANQQLVLAALSAQELQVAAEKAQQRQTEFLAVMAHELRNPLTPIRIAATLMGQVPSEGLPRLQTVIERQVVHMTRLLNDLLDVSRASTGKLRLDRQKVELASVIDQAVATCRPSMDVRLQHFVVQVPACALEVDGDPVRLAQILSNLLDNASKYTPEGGEIGLSVVVADDAVLITVSDSGIGITAEALPSVFEPFVQDKHAIAFNQVGLGIGLTVVCELVRAHGGSVAATSAGAGLGSQFVVTLPLRPLPTIAQA